MEPIPEPNDPKADLLGQDPDQVGDPGTDDLTQDPDQTSDPGQFDGIDPIEGTMGSEPTGHPEQTITGTAPPPTEPVSGDSSDGLGTVIPWVLVVLLLAAVVALAVKAFGRGGRTAPAPAPPVTASVPVVAPAPDQSMSPVVPELITLADLITTPAAQSQVVRALRTVGVEAVEASVGAPFNPDLHEAVATRPADDPSQVNMIAVVHRAGWQSAHGVVRPAGVEVWTDSGEGT